MLRPADTLRPFAAIGARAARPDQVGTSRARWARGKRGAALLIVLWVSVAAGALFFASTKDVIIEIRRQKAALDAVTAEAAARGGIEKARYILATIQPTPDSANPFSGLALVDSFAGTEFDNARYFLLSEVSSDNAPPALGLVDLSARLNLNTATLTAIEQLPNMTPDLAAAIMDFRNPGTSTEPGGAPSAFYQSLPIPYSARNAPLESLSELLLIRGMTPAILYGSDRNLNGVLDTNENDGGATFPPDSANGVLDRGLYPFVTLTSASPAHPVGTQGADWINLNSTSESWPTIRTFLQQKHVSQTAVSDVQRTMYPNASRRGGMGPRHTLTSLGELVLRNPELASQYKTDLATIYGCCATSTTAMSTGLIDVNSAPEEVLLTLPSIDESIATGIIATRQAGGATFSTVCWLLDVPGITPQIFAQIAPLVTTQCAYYGVDSVGANADGSVWYRIFATIDTTSSQMTIESFQVPDATGGKPIDLQTAQEIGWPKS